MIKRFLCILLCALFVFCPLVCATESIEIKDFSASVGLRKLTDNNVRTYSAADSVMLSGVSGAKYVYLVFWDAAPTVSVTVNGKTVVSENKFLQNLITLPESANDSIEIKFDKKVNLSEIRVFKEGELPNDVPRWTKPIEKADLLLVATHSDDDQLFFAGLLPYYAGEKKYSVQVAYFIDHNRNVVRRHELLEGLWTVGVTAYPVISFFPDEYSESYDEALKNLNRHGFTEKEIIDWQTELIKRFKPLVVVSHDLAGEYGHGQHILCAETLIKGIENAAATHKVQKLYLHLYKENEITMNYDTPLESFGGKTAFEVSKLGFECHKTQHQYWFYEWLNKRERAADITSYSPCKFGLYKSEVGADITGGDMFENIKTYGEIAEEQNTLTPEPEIKNPVFETKPGKDYTAYYIIAAAAGVVVILVLLIILKKRKSTK